MSCFNYNNVYLEFSLTETRGTGQKKKIEKIFMVKTINLVLLL